MQLFDLYVLLVTMITLTAYNHNLGQIGAINKYNNQ